MKSKDERLSTCLTVLLALFVFRVAAQLIQAINPISILPPFNDWHSGALPYPLLLTFQMAIVGICSWVVIKIRAGTLHADQKWGLIWLVLGFVYLSVMLFRLVAGLSFGAGHPWLGAFIPAVFHLVLASFVITVGFYHWPVDEPLIPWLVYPGAMLSTQIVHLVCVYRGIDLQVATYGPVLLGALGVTVLERAYPHRRSWLADRQSVAEDTTYMLLVQVLLPRILAFFVAFSLLDAQAGRTSAITQLWPHQWPVYGQMILMLLGAEFMRYWVHRLAHAWAPLWRLHAIHHSPHKLYWLNVGRFHPLEKGLQFLFDALPFLLLGVSQEVLALYFVFYAVNGFFQHCNVDVRLGWLNYVVSGPELHRWHHSKYPEESNRNYGNNLILWDLLFGTWFLPRDRKVGELGLLNRNYPMGFVEQMKSPFDRQPASSP